MNINFTIKLYKNSAYAIFERKNAYCLPVLICVGIFVYTGAFSQFSSADSLRFSLCPSFSNSLLKVTSNKNEFIYTEPSFKISPISPKAEKEKDCIEKELFFFNTILMFNNLSFQRMLVNSFFNGECQLAFPEIKTFQVFNSNTKRADFFNSIKIRKKEVIRPKYSLIEYG